MNLGKKTNNNLNLLKKKISRRSALSTVGKVALSTVIAGVVAGVGGYYAGKSSAPTATATTTVTSTVGAKGTVTETMTETMTETVTKTVGAAPKKITTISDSILSKYIRFYKDAVERDLGIKLEVIEALYGELFEKISTDVISGANRFDLFLGPGDFIGTLASQGWILPLDDFMQTYPYLDDYLPWIRNRVMKWGGHYYGLAFDGDCHILAYRKDLFRNPEYREMFKEKYNYDLPDPPKTIDELIDVAEFFNGWDWDGDGEPEYGIAFSAKRAGQTAWTIIDFVAQYAVKPGPPSKYTGVLYFDPETMEPLTNTPGWIEGFKKWQEIVKHGPPGLPDFDVSDTRGLYMAGDVAIAIDWSDSGPLSISPDSKVKGKMAWAKLPGAPKYWDREKQKWVEEFNQITLLNFGGWVWYVMKGVKEKGMENLVRIFLTYMTTSDKAAEMAVAHGETGVNIFRYSHLYSKNPDYWIKQGWDPESAENYCNTVMEVYESPNVVLDIRIPGFERYWDALDEAAANVASGTWGPEDACNWLYDEWSRITEELGKDKQLKWYRQDLGLST